MIRLHWETLLSPQATARTLTERVIKKKAIRLEVFINGVPGHTKCSAHFSPSIPKNTRQIAERILKFFDLNPLAKEDFIAIAMKVKTN
jgi:hypothetical protein